MSWTKVCSAAELPEEVGIAALVKDKQVAIFRSEDKLFAVDNHDPFSKANVLSRGLIGDTNDEPYIASPIYKQRFSLLSGKCLDDDTVSIPTYDVRLNGGNVEVAVA